MWLKVGLAFSKLHEEQRMESVLWIRNSWLVLAIVKYCNSPRVSHTINAKRTNTFNPKSPMKRFDHGESEADANVLSPGLFPAVSRQDSNPLATSTWRNEQKPPIAKPRSHQKLAGRKRNILHLDAETSLTPSGNEFCILCGSPNIRNIHTSTATINRRARSRRSTADCVSSLKQVWMRQVWTENRRRLKKMTSRWKIPRLRKRRKTRETSHIPRRNRPFPRPNHFVRRGHRDEVGPTW